VGHKRRSEMHNMIRDLKNALKERTGHGINLNQKKRLVHYNRGPIYFTDPADPAPGDQFPAFILSN